jgi:hypothetical protein
VSAHASDARRGFALVAALGAIGVLASLAVLAQLSARMALREVTALRAEAQAEASRESLRARAALAIARTPRGSLLAAAARIGGTDTAVTVTAGAWPWHRVEIAAAGETVAAEFARASVPPLWCAAIASAGMTSIAPGTLRLAVPSPCASSVAVIDSTGYASFASALERDLVLRSIPDSVTVAATELRTGVIVALQRVTVAAGASVVGVIVARDVRVGTGATLEGAIVAADTVVVQTGATVVGDERIALEALRGAARLRMLGRRGLVLLPPR